MFRWTIGTLLAVGLASASLFWNASGNQFDSKTDHVESLLPPCLPRESAVDSSIPALAIDDGGATEMQSVTQFVPFVAVSNPEPDASRLFVARAPVTALAQFGNRGPGGVQQPGGANRPGGGAGNGNQFPGGASPFGGSGQGTGGVCIAPKIRLEADATADLTNCRDHAVLDRPSQGRFFSD